MKTEILTQTAQHTLGPIIVGKAIEDLREIPSLRWHCHLYTEDNGPTVVFTAWGYTREEAEARARLIASAPELLTALQKANDLLSEAYSNIPFKKEIQAHLPFGFSDKIRDGYAKDTLGIQAAIRKATLG